MAQKPNVFSVLGEYPARIRLLIRKADEGDSGALEELRREEYFMSRFLSSLSYMGPGHDDYGKEEMPLEIPAAYQLAPTRNLAKIADECLRAFLPGPEQWGYFTPIMAVTMWPFYAFTARHIPRRRVWGTVFPSANSKELSERPVEVTDSRVESDLVSKKCRLLKLDDSLVAPFTTFFGHKDYLYFESDHFVDFYSLSADECDPLKSDRLVLVYRAISNFSGKVRTAVYYKGAQSGTFFI